jgi:hypothetical protein
MKARGRRIGLACGLLALPAGALAQTAVGDNVEGGLHWSVSAPQGASWRLVCRHPPITWRRSNYDQKAWANRFTEAGQGAARGRLPLDRGYCEVTKTGGAGPVAIAVGRTGAVDTGVTRAIGQSANAELF